MRDWSNLDDRFDVWKVVERRDGSKELNSKTSKVYEIMTILSALCCGSLIGLPESNNEYEIIKYLFKSIKAYGIISSIFCSVISITLCSLINVTSNEDTIKFVYMSLKFSNFPFFGIIFSLICLILCTSFYFETLIMIITMPYSIGVILFCFYFYNSVYNYIFYLTHQNKYKYILENKIINNQLDNL